MARNKTGEKNPAAVALGQLGARKGGLARAASLTPEQRRESARQAAFARMKKLTPSERAAGASKAAQARWAAFRASRLKLKESALVFPAAPRPKPTSPRSKRNDAECA